MEGEVKKLLEKEFTLRLLHKGQIRQNGCFVIMEY